MAFGFNQAATMALTEPTAATETAIKADEALIEEMCVYCNNFFTPKNKPVFDYQNVLDNAPKGFLILADRIADYMAHLEITNITATAVSAASETVSLEFSSWKIMFSQDLAIYKRVRML